MKSRIEKILNESNLKKYEFAQKLNIAPSYIPKLLSGKSCPSDRLIEDICRKFNINEHWLRTGEGDMHNLPLDERATYISYLLENIDMPISNLMISILDAYLQLDNEKDKIVINNFIDSLINNKRTEK